MRLVLVTYWPTDVIGGSGTAVFFNALTSGLEGRGYELEVIAPNFDISDYVEVTLRRFLFNTELRTDPRVAEADVVIGFDYDGYGLDPATRPPMISSAHAVYGDFVQWEAEPIRTMVQAQAFFDRVSMERADHITIGSQYAKDRIVELYEISSEKITVIAHGMLEPSWLPLVDAEPRVENDHPVLLSVGKMYPRKRTDVLLRAIPLLVTKYPTLELRVVGDGLEWDRLHSLAESLNIEEYVTWLSHISDDRAFAREWRQADVFCHPSSQETFGFVYLEAMRLGKPIVAMRSGAAPEVLDEVALLAEPENPQSLANMIDHFLSDKDLREEFGQLAQERATLYTHARMIDGYVSVIERVIAESRVKSRS
jgi:glycosyltransferase involved in cell wall biosynthesis